MKARWMNKAVADMKATVRQERAEAELAFWESNFPLTGSLGYQGVMPPSLFDAITATDDSAVLLWDTTPSETRSSSGQSGTFLPALFAAGYVAFWVALAWWRLS